MRDLRKFYIDGRWVDPAGDRTHEVINPATEEVAGVIALGNEEDVNRAVAAAVRAFPSYSQTTPAERIELLKKILEVYGRRHDEVATAIMEEMGAPWKLAKQAQAGSGPQHFGAAVEALETFAFEEVRGTTAIRKEAIGPVALITPWNWPMNQVAVKVAPALAAGCTMVLKPSENSPFSAMILADILHEAGVPPGVFNLVNGDGPVVGTALATHPDIAMISFTGSTRAGVEVAKNAAPTVKRVAQELGGKSPNVILDDADLERAVTYGVRACFTNSGQSCNAPTRMFVPREKLAAVNEIAKRVAEKTRVGDPTSEETQVGPVVSKAQWERVESFIDKGLEEGATLLTGGPGLPEGLDHGYYVKPTIFTDVDNHMTIAQEEIFGPVLCIIPYDSEDDAVRMANDTPYGLSGYVSSENLEHARAVASRLRTGMVHLNGAPLDAQAPFGGYKQSGNGREWGPAGIDEFLEVKSVYGYEPRKAG